MKKPSNQCRWLLYATGIFLSDGFLKRHLGRLSAGLCLFANFWTLFSCGYRLASSPSLLFQSSETVVALATTLNSLPSHANLLARRPSLEYLVGRMDAAYLASEGWQKYTFLRSSKTSRKITIALNSMFAVIVSTSFVISIFQTALTGRSYLDMELILPPIPADTLYYALNQMTTYLIFTACAASILAKYALLNLLTLQLCAMMKILGGNLRRVKTTSKDGVLLLDETRGKLKECVKQHMAITGLVNEVNSIFSVMLMFEFITASIQCCFAGYLCAKIGDSQVNATSSVFAFLSTLSMPYLMCWLGSKMQTESRKARECLYFMQWEDFPPSLRKDVFLMMTAWNDLVLRFSSVFVFKIKHYTSILQTSYSYFTLLCSLE